MNKAIFLDRDGVVNYERGTYNLSLEDFVINEGIAESIKLLKDNGYLVIIISNQGAIAKGMLTESMLLEMHLKLCQHLYEYNTKIDDYFYCPHHDAISKCICRKPDSLLFEKAISIYNIDVSNSLMIGDSERDILSANKVGIKAIKIKANQNIYSICEKFILENNG